jgi:hypothetical protein
MKYNPSCPAFTQCKQFELICKYCEFSKIDGLFEWKLYFEVEIEIDFKTRLKFKEKTLNTCMNGRKNLKEHFYFSFFSLFIFSSEENLFTFPSLNAQLFGTNNQAKCIP